MVEKTSVETSVGETKALGVLHGLASTPWPAIGLSGLLIGTSLLSPKHPSLPPFVQRFSFGFVFAGAGYIVNTGDVRNGSGVATAWSLTYLLLNRMRSHFYPPEVPVPRTPLSLLLSGATASVAALYGVEHFVIDPGLQVTADVS
ncbi:uncharacterized protein EI90DRAFT_3075054 [Cantharellus anzutake]|uniref:uncharacterized protein n=1 Tax=Cantharellus anzutake TaxID=1750568 RepID=UPI001906449F|nr:uncharacterized protein EI90DRAFT_3075054 [Cantharellus anzutake]KAF8324555.1 hypothetical protein EI90DRAFT_3075054 [Cantharellus anzutake]